MANLRHCQRPFQSFLKYHLLIRNKNVNTMTLLKCNNYCQNNSVKLIKNNSLLNSHQINCKLLIKSSVYENVSRAFRTSSPRYNPLVTIVLRQIAKVAALITGRAIRKWWGNMPPNKRQLIKQWSLRHKWKFLFGCATIVASFWLYYELHVQETPITKRKRFIAFTPQQFERISNYVFEVQLEMFKDRLLPSTHPDARRVAKVATQLLNGNNDLDQIHDRQWSISVVNESHIKNAFVMPNGQIFVFMGMLSLCDNDQQLGVILAHEMAHAVLGHGAELVSHAHIIDLIFICLIGALWAVIPSDSIALLSTFISRKVMDLILDRPYRKMLETEADIVGLELAAKACFDVRESSAFWHKMSFLQQLDTPKIVTSDDVQIPVNIEFLSTHPSHESRYTYLDSIMDEAIKMRENCKCPQLPRVDPRSLIDMMKKNAQIEYAKRKTEGVIVLKKPSRPTI